MPTHGIFFLSCCDRNVSVRPTWFFSFSSRAWQPDVNGDDDELPTKTTENEPTVEASWCGGSFAMNGEDEPGFSSRTIESFDTSSKREVDRDVRPTDDKKDGELTHGDGLVT